MTLSPMLCQSQDNASFGQDMSGVSCAQTGGIAGRELPFATARSQEPRQEVEWLSDWGDDIFFDHGKYRRAENAEKSRDP
jgi:hypothetical protein